MANTGTPGTSERQVRTSEDLVQRIDVGWRPFRDRVRGLGRARIDERTAAEWTFRDLIAHVAAWEQLTARRLAIFRETGEQKGPAEVEDVDVFNKRVVEAHRLVGAEALIDELDTAHRALVREVAALSNDQVSRDVRDTPSGPVSWVVAIVAGSSYEHYDEHAAELPS